MSRATRLLLAQFGQLQQAGLDQLAAAAADSDGKPASGGWKLDHHAAEWVRVVAPAPTPPAPDPEAPGGA